MYFIVHAAFVRIKLMMMMMMMMITYLHPSSPPDISLGQHYLKVNEKLIRR